MPEEERMEIIQALKAVDRVLLSKHSKSTLDTSVCSELEEIKPDIFANGGDRLLNNIPEVDTCSKIGAKMIFGVGQGGKIQSSSWLLKNYAEFVRQNYLKDNLDKSKKTKKISKAKKR